MAQVRVRAVANVMGLRRGDTGDVETGSTHVDAMINAGYLEVLEYLPDPEPRVPVAKPERAKQFAHRNSFAEAEVAEIPDVVEVKSDGKPRKARPRPSRPRSAARSAPASDSGDGSDARQGVGDSAGGHGEPASPTPDAGSAQQP